MFFTESTWEKIDALSPALIVVLFFSAIIIANVLKLRTTKKRYELDLSEEFAFLPRKKRQCSKK